ncbi:MAG: hypothetical protein WCJ30_15055 [Deltaproteobacteria bacterium]
MKYVSLSLIALCIGCSNGVTPTDAGADTVSDTGGALDAPASDTPGAPDAVSNDVVPVDAPSIDGGPIACGTMTCAAGQICLEVGGGAGISWSCVDLPASCGGLVTCGCLTSVCTQDIHTRCNVDGRNVSCACLDCP